MPRAIVPGAGSRWPWLLAAAAWLLAVGAGFACLWRYAAARGTDSKAPALWPAASRLAPPGDRAALIVFVHPRCPCSRATLTELGHVLTRAGNRLRATVVFVEPAGVSDEWKRTDLRAQAERLAVTIADDPGGVEAHRFGATTSGATLLYDRARRLAFAGGLTSVRGHAGDSFGEERIIALVTTGSADRNDSPVFGCPLVDSHKEQTPCPPKSTSKLPRAPSSSERGSASSAIASAPSPAPIGCS